MDAVLIDTFKFQPVCRARIVSPAVRSGSKVRASSPLVTLPRSKWIFPVCVEQLLASAANVLRLNLELVVLSPYRACTVLQAATPLQHYYCVSRLTGKAGEMAGANEPRFCPVSCAAVHEPAPRSPCMAFRGAGR